MKRIIKIVLLMFLALSFGNVADATTQSTVNTILSPIGGEAWKKESVQTIKWSMSTAVKNVDISIMAYCDPGLACGYQPYKIAEKVSSSLGGYSWSVGKVSEYNKSVSTQLPENRYNITVCESGTNNCVSSKTYFKIVSPEPVSILSTSCEITTNSCVNYPAQANKIFNDTWFPKASSTQSICLQRAADYVSWCGGLTSATAKFKTGTTVTAQKTATTSSTTTPIPTVTPNGVTTPTPAVPHINVNDAKSSNSSLLSNIFDAIKGLLMR